MTVLPEGIPEDSLTERWVEILPEPDGSYLCRDRHGRYRPVSRPPVILEGEIVEWYAGPGPDDFGIRLRQGG